MAIEKATEFKAKCLGLIDEIAGSGEEIANDGSRSRAP